MQQSCQGHSPVQGCGPCMLVHLRCCLQEGMSQSCSRVGLTPHRQPLSAHARTGTLLSQAETAWTRAQTLRAKARTHSSTSWCSLPAYRYSGGMAARQTGAEQAPDVVIELSSDSDSDPPEPRGARRHSAPQAQLAGHKRGLPAAEPNPRQPVSQPQEPLLVGFFGLFTNAGMLRRATGRMQGRTAMPGSQR